MGTGVKAATKGLQSTHETLGEAEQRDRLCVMGQGGEPTVRVPFPLKKKINKQIWKTGEKLEGEKGFQRLFILLPILKTERQKLAEILLRKIQKRWRMMTQERRRG